MVQAMQVVVQNNLISAALRQGNQPLRIPAFARGVNTLPWLHGITARFAARRAPGACALLGFRIRKSRLSFKNFSP